MTIELSGDRRTMAIGFELLSDPDSADTRPDRAGSWGAFQLWVGGRNLTQGVLPDGTSTDHVECPLLPLVTWVARNWDPLFHQSRLPRPGPEYGTSARWHSRSIEGLDGDDSLVDARLEWWRQHGLGAALPDYRIPDLHIRRMDGDVELSWDDAEWRSVPKGIVLSEGTGAALIRAEVVAELLHAWCRAVVAACRGRCDSAVLADTARLLDGLRDPSRTLPRLVLAAGMASLEKAARRLLDLTGVPGGDLAKVISSMFQVEGSPSELVARLTVPVLLFRSSAPTLTEADLDQLLALVPRREAEEVAFPERHPVPCSLEPRGATQNGYELALDLRESLGVGEAEPLSGKWDLEKVILRDMGITLRDVALTDTRTEGVSIYVQACKPAVAINSAGRFSSKTWGRRMTLAHELCHLLHDGAPGRGVGVVSNAWAPYLIERRANAFAAHLLAPPSALRALLGDDPALWTSEDLGDAMKKLGVGAHTLVRQLQNLRWITEPEAGAWLDVLAGEA